ncbi:hypothetical protein [Burkholderia alba]|uniref:hypothetical protein n=1 Tax=Burkholderia alba TaxID=2683677 RepID=UPI002B05F48D|nr:hypothetical protein [Burkholderia alba]
MGLISGAFAVLMSVWIAFDQHTARVGTSGFSIRPALPEREPDDAGALDPSTSARRAAAAPVLSPEPSGNAPRDIRQYIAARYRDPDRRAAMLQFVRARQAALDLGGTPDGARAGMAMLARSIECVSQVMGAGYYRHIDEILLRVTNPKTQLAALARFADNLGDQVIAAPQDSTPCDDR